MWLQLALMTTELSTMYPENGGFVLWAKAAFGDAAGGMAGWLQFSFSAVDSALYPGLFVVYLAQTFQVQFSPEMGWLLQAFFIVVMTVVNLGGIDSVGHGSAAMMLFLLLPFTLIVVIAFTGIPTGTAVTGWKFQTENLWQGVSEVPWPSLPVESHTPDLSHLAVLPLPALKANYIMILPRNARLMICW